MMSNVKKKDVPLISISLVAILFIAAALSLFPQQSADAANAIYTFVTRTLGSAVQVLVLLAMGLVIYLATSKYAIFVLAKENRNTARSPGCLCLFVPV